MIMKFQNAKTRRTASSMVVSAAALLAVRSVLAGVSTAPNNPDVPAGDTVPTISISGSTALKNFLISPGITYLTTNSSITLGSGSATQPEVAYNNTSGAISYQLAASNFGSPDTTTGSTVIRSGLRLEYHEAGAAEGPAELVDSQINENTFPDNSVYNPNTTQAVWVNRSKFGGNSPFGPIPTLGSPATNTGGFTLNFQPSTLPRDPQAQSRVQIAVGDTSQYQVFSYSGGTPSAMSTPQSAGYGKGNPALSVISSPETFGAGTRYQLFDQTLVNMPAGANNPSYDANSPRTGNAATYDSGAWNTAGVGNLRSTVIAQTATLYAANPGTGLDHLNRTNAQWLLTTGRLQNGADFNVTTRDLGSGTRNTSAVNVGIDPSWAVGKNDVGNGNAPDGGTAQIAIGSSLAFSNKTSGGAGLRPTLQVSRMAIGTLGLSDAIGSTKNSTSNPLRALAYRDDSNDIADNSNGSTFKNFNEDGSGNSTFTTGDLATGTFIAPSARSITNGSYVIYQNEQFITVKVPTAALYNTNVIKGDNGTTVAVDANGNDNLTAAQGSTGHDVADFINNITSAVANEPLPNSTTLANPADALLATSYIIPSLMLVQKSVDGLNQSVVNPNYNKAYRTNDFLAASVTNNNFTPAAPDSVTTGSSALYGNNKVFDPGLNATRGAIGGAIPITNNNYFFGNFNQTDPSPVAGAFPNGTHAGVRDLSDLPEAFKWAGALYNSGLSSNWDVGAGSNATVVTLGGGGTGKLAFAVTKGDLITLGDFNGDGSFNGKDIYLMAHGSSLTDSSATPNFTTGANTYLTTASVPFAGATFGDMVRYGFLHKNDALDYVLGATGDAAFNGSSGAPTNASGFLRQTAQAVLAAATVPAGATDLHTTQAVTGLEQFTFDPSGVHAFDKHDVNRDGVVDFNDATLVDQNSGNSYTNLTQSLAATQLAPVTGQVIPLSLVDVQQVDSAAAIGTADLSELNTGLTGSGDTNWYGYSLAKTGTGMISWNRTGGTVRVYSGAAFNISAGTVHVTSAIDAFTDSSVSLTSTTTSSSVAVTVGTGATLQYTGASTTGVQTSRLASLTVATGGQVTLDAPANQANRMMLITGGLTLNGTGSVDLGTNEMIVKGGSLSTIVAALGTGITSSSLAGHPLNTIGVINGSDLGGGTFDGITPAAADVLVKYTYFGDANLDGAVDGSDYTKIDAGFNGGLTGWANGDFNYDGKVDGSDYTLIDNAFNTQGASLGSNPAILYASSTAQIAGTSAVPEPTTLGLVAIGATGLLARRRRRN